ncbi:MAG: class I SAM-dependent methyltransferase [Pseudomonadota bacterium]|nr:class I SAM-dependent methyltransferase [Pseudomonadota bacterium]
MTRPIIAPEPAVARTRAWADYALLDSGGGRKLERYGQITVVRPEPQCWWSPRLSETAWAKADAVFDPTPSDDEDAGRWKTAKALPETWPLAWGEARFLARLTPFRHLGFFPEQAANWAYLTERLKALPGEKRVLNLFGYTGVASLAAAAAGASVTHVDASKKSVGYARENATLAGLDDRPIRWIVEDARRYVQREVKRGSRYEAIILDPPKYGRGPTGEVWRLFEDLPGLLTDCAALLSNDADTLLLNAYAARISGLSLAHLMAEATAGRGGRIDWGELALVEEGADAREIGLSFFARWVKA